MSSEYENSRIPPGVLFRSFALVTGIYIAIVVLLALIEFSIAYSFFPETRTLLEMAQVKDTDEYQRFLTENAGKLFPPEFYWPVVLLNAFVTYCAGRCIATYASFAKFPHALFLGALLFAGFLQQAIACPPDLQTMYIMLMGSSPIAMLIGASQCVETSVEPIEEDQ